VLSAGGRGLSVFFVVGAAAFAGPFFEGRGDTGEVDGAVAVLVAGEGEASAVAAGGEDGECGEAMMP
jgi:hypothetical protein